MDTDFKQIARDFIVRPAIDAWGRGWHRLSDEQRDTEIRAAFAKWITGAAFTPSAKIDAQVIREMWDAVTNERAR